MTTATGPTLRPELLVPGTTARFVDGLAAAPEGAPAAIQEMIWAGNELIGLPYIYGGGHGSFVSPGYDCSGTVSFALHGAALLATPEDSSEFEAWGSRGVGRWVTIFANGGHAYMTVAGCVWTPAPPKTPPTSRVLAGARCARRTRASSSATPSDSERPFRFVGAGGSLAASDADAVGVRP